jgi:hypothetical protein
MSVNLFGDEWEGGRERPGRQWKHLPVGRKRGAERIGVSLFCPDSGKVGLWGEGIGKILDQNAELDYFHGEE